MEEGWRMRQQTNQPTEETCVAPLRKHTSVLLCVSSGSTCGEEWTRGMSYLRFSLGLIVSLYSMCGCSDDLRSWRHNYGLVDLRELKSGWVINWITETWELKSSYRGINQIQKNSCLTHKIMVSALIWINVLLMFVPWRLILTFVLMTDGGEDVRWYRYQLHILPLDNLNNYSWCAFAFFRSYEYFSSCE